MASAQVLPNENSRLEALRSYHILDTTPEEVFDDLVHAASLICKAPIALLVLVDEARQWFKARIGLEITETPREWSFCAHAILGSSILIVQDATTDPRFSDNPLVTAEPKIRFYAGVPLVNPEGFALGSLCILDRTPRMIGAEEIRALRALARQVMLQIELRRTLMEADLQTAERVRHVDESRFQALIENSADAVALFSAEGRILYQSRSTRRVLGYGPAELVGRDAFELIHPEDRESVRQSLTLCMAKPGGVSLARARVRHKDGRWCRLEGDFTNLLHHPTVHAVVNNYRDVTARHALEEQLRQSQKMEAVGRLAGGVAHDFNNLLTVITGYGHLLLNSLPKDNPCRDDAQEIIRAGDRAATLTRHLLAFSRKQILAPKILNLTRAVSEFEKLLRRLVGEDIEFVLSLDPHLGNAKADPGQIEQILMHLAVNARDAMPRGGLLTLKTANIELDENAARECPGLEPGSHVMLEVSDTGVGMDQETLSHLFEPFFTTKETGKGTGLGLSTVYGIVKQR